MKLSKRILSAFLAMIMVLSVVTVVSAANVTFTDVSGHWAWTGGQIQYLVDKGVLNGYQQSNGTYKFVPDGEVTRAEFIKMLDETFGLTATASINFSDVKSTDWHYPYFAKAAAQGYLLNYGTSVSPNGKITREEAISLLVRYLDLPASEKASTDYFADYSSITENYRDYVLRGIYAGLTDGYNEYGAKYFKPQKTLTRAEALTILYRAAGCIYNTNAYSRDDAAADTNNVITKGGVILNGINLTGRVIVSEGATSGTVSIYGCSINDTLYIRGTADVVLDDCKVKNVVITNGCKLSVQNGTEVENITVYGKSTLNIYSNISVGVLDVENGADDTSVNGNGAIQMAYINASGFTSSMVPTEFQIGNNLTATFASTQYQGSSDAQESFTMTPFITSDESNYYLNLFPAVDGTVYYYFTNGSNAPTTSSFDSYYESSSYTGAITVKAGAVTTEKTYSASSVKNFEYVVLQIQDGSRKYAPVMIPNTNTDGNGFSTTPYLADETTIKFVAAQGGTLYWFYSESGEKLNQAEFIEAYSKADGTLKDNSSVVSGRTLSLSLSTKYLKNNDYVVMMLKSGAGSYFTPVVVSAGDNGFTEGPTLKSVGTVSYKTSVSGEIYYYYSENSDLPAAADFKSQYNAAEYAKNGIDVTKNKEGTFDYKTSYSDEYPYLIISIKSNGEYMQPVALNIDYSTGFVSEPEIVDENTIRFKTEDDGEVMYYYTKTETAPSSEDFVSRYSSVGKSYKDTVDVDDNSYERITYSKTTAQTYPYMVFMFVDDQENEYTPVVLELDATANTGFSINPYINGDDVYFKTVDSGEVWYFYSKTGEAVASSDFYEEWDDAKEAHSEDVNGGSFDSFELDDDVDYDKYPYLVIAFIDEEGLDADDKDEYSFYYPVVIEIENSVGGSGLSVDYIDDKIVTVTPVIDGTLYYYFTNSSKVPSSSRFDDYYDDAERGYYGDKNCYEGRDIDIDIEDKAEDYGYLVVCILVDDGDDEMYLTPIIIDLEEGTSSNTGNDGANKGGYGLSITNIDPNEHIATFLAEHDGTVYITLEAGSYKDSLGTIDVSKNDEYAFNYDKYVDNQVVEFITGGDDIYICFQLVSSNGKDTYRTYKLEVNE